MINKICANIDKNHIYNCNSKTIGRQGENICTQLEITLEECLCDSWVFLHFEKADGTTKVTPKLEIVDNVVIYDIGNDLLDIAGDLKVFVELHKESGLVWKSSTKTYTVLDSFNGADQIENKEDFITEAQKTLNHLNSIEEGKSASVQVGEVETLEAGSLAYVENVGSETDVILNFGIPKGEDGTGGGSAEIDINIENGDGDNSLQQAIESTSWDAKNEAVKYYITEEIGTEDDSNKKIVHEGNTIITGTFGKSSFMQNGKGQTVGGKSHAEGSKCIAFENNSHAEGNETFAGGKHSHAEGNTTSALGNASHAEGLLTASTGVGSHSEGMRSVALGDYSHAEGVDTRAEVQYSHSEGSNTVASGDTSHAEGNWTTASGTYSHSEGNHTSAQNDCAHAEGYESIASGVYSHAEGNSTVASGNFSHTEGSNTHAESVGSHAEGVDTFASNDCTHAEGYQTKANGIYSHAEGYGTVAERPFSHVQGTFNLIDTNKEFLHIVGNGMSENDRSNAYTLDWNGNGVYKGDLKINGNRKVATTSQNNNFSVSQTINGTLTVNGDIVQNGESYETHAEQLYTEKDEIITRDGAIGGLSENQLTGIRAKKYDGVNDGQLGFDADGTARVGDVNDTQPLLTRDETENLSEGQVLVWDGTKLRAVGSSEYTKNAVEKVEYNSTDGSLRGRVYVVDHTGEQTTKELRTTGTVDSIPLRNARGNFYVGTPSLDLECVNKKYVDGLVGDIESLLSEV